ncbi:hypothetical protein GUJ93_ZPchr0008g11591 [Zizania palustris]|uniref:Uncharacterized protein n=1 Tax=Zizania palustris TaxID=103762 RepID=A0A8J5RFU0_ZIZPA|nr:hypothetical protein GUJ93_ZPchr0008g11591 [Zizania palustris]
MDFDAASNEMLSKFAAFLVVQTLVYLILSQSSGVFSSGGDAGKAMIRRASFRRSESARLMVTLLLSGGKPSSPAARKRGGRPNGDGADMDVERGLMLIRCQF